MNRGGGSRLAQVFQEEKSVEIQQLPKTFNVKDEMKYRCEITT